MSAFPSRHQLPAPHLAFPELPKGALCTWIHDIGLSREGEDEHGPTVSSLHLFTVHPRSSVPVTCGGPCLSPAQVADKRQGEGPRASFISAVLLLNQHQVLAAKIDG